MTPCLLEPLATRLGWVGFFALMALRRLGRLYADCGLMAAVGKGCVE